MKHLYWIFIVGTLSAHAYAQCPNNFTDHTDVDILHTTFMAPVDNHCTDGAYEIVTLPDNTFYPIYNGFLDGTAVPLCNDGYLSGNNCVPFTSGDCDTGYYSEDSLYASTFMAPVSSHCTDGAYEYRTDITDMMYPIYNGFLAGDTATLCGSGAYLANGTTCTNYVADDCPNNFVDITTNDELFTMTNAGTCGTNHEIYNIHQQCDSNTTDSMCAVLCTDGLLYTDAGTCATLCTAGATSLNMRKTPDSPIISFPVYATQQTFPSVAFDINGQVCFVNLVAGTANDALHFKSGDTVYHTIR